MKNTDYSTLVFKKQLNPNPTQLAQIKSNAGGARYAYNQMLALTSKQYELYKYGIAEKPELNHYALRKTWNELKPKLAPWWSENEKNAYSSSMKDLSNAYSNFFTGKSSYPKFKSRSNKNSYSTDTASLKNDGHSIHLPRIGRVRSHERFKAAEWLLKCGATLQLATVSVEPSGRVYVSLRLRVPQKLMLAFLRGKFKRKSSGFIGVDVGLSSFLTTSSSEVVDNPRFLKKLELKLARAQRAHSKKVKGSKNRELARVKIAKLHERVRHQREDFHWKTARSLVEYNSVITVESLSVKNMLKNHALAYSINDAAWGSFFSKLKSLSNQYGSTVIEADRWFASSKTCSECRVKKANLLLSERVFECEDCGLSLDRDLNAAVNLCKYGMDALRYSESLNGGKAHDTGIPVMSSRDQVLSLRAK